jgi:molecular chaperone DnaK
MVDYSNIPRDSRRVPLETRVQFKFDRFTGFISEFSENISPGGMFIRTRAPQPPGTVLDLEFRLGDGFELIKGTGEVVWNRAEDEGAARPSGMGIRFLELSQGSKDLIYRIVDQHIQRGGTPFDVMQRPPDLTPAAPAPRYPMPVPPAPPPVSAPAPFPDIFDLPPPLAASRPLAVAPSRSSPEQPGLVTSQEGRSDPLPRAAREPAGPLPPPAPMFSATFGSAVARQPRRALPWVLLAVGLVLIAGVFLARDRLTQWMELAGSDEQAAGTPIRPTRRPLARTVPEPAAPQPGQAAPPLSPATSTASAGEDTPVTSAADKPAASAPSASSPSAPSTELDAGPALSQLDRITWETPGGETDVVLWGNGAIGPEVYSRTRLDGNPPRELIRLSGIRRPYPVARVVVGSPEVLQVRLGYHPETGRGELHVVLDLARPEVVVVGVESGPHQLRIRLRRK